MCMCVCGGGGGGIPMSDATAFDKYALTYASFFCICKVVTYIFALVTK